MLQIELPTIGHHIALFHHVPETKKFKEPVIVCHGLGANRFNMDFSYDGLGGDRISLARTLAKEGFDVWVLELRGRGRATVPRRADWSVDDEVREDLPRAIETVVDLTGSDGVLWVGHSKGSLLQYLLQAEQLPAASKVKGLVAIGSPGTFQYQRRDLQRLMSWGRFFASRGRKVPLSVVAKLGIPIAGLVYFIGKRTLPVLAAIDVGILRRIMASLAADIAPGVMHQFAEWFRNGGFLTKRDGTRYDESFSKITLPMLLIAGSADFLAPPASVEFVFDRVASKDKTLLVLGKETGCAVDYGHGDLVIGHHAPDDVFPKIVTWLQTHATAID